MRAPDSLPSENARAASSAPGLKCCGMRRGRRGGLAAEAEAEVAAVAEAERGGRAVAGGRTLDPRLFCWVACRYRGPGDATAGKMAAWLCVPWLTVAGEDFQWSGFGCSVERG